MIKVHIKKKDNMIVQIQLNGHAGFADYGKDIVCAGVSSILTTTVNAILMFDESSIEIEEKDDFIIKVKKKDEITEKLLENMILLFQELESAYPKNVKLKEDIETC